MFTEPRLYETCSVIFSRVLTGSLSIAASLGRAREGLVKASLLPFTTSDRSGSRNFDASKRKQGTRVGERPPHGIVYTSCSTYSHEIEDLPRKCRVTATTLSFRSCVHTGPASMRFSMRSTPPRLDRSVPLCFLCLPPVISASFQRPSSPPVLARW